MIAITDAFVDAAAPNAEAARNGRDLVKKNKFLTYHRSDDGTLLFGECQGSGKVPYQCSCDFVRPDQPTYRCSCPSRQFPCKHCLGLLAAHAQGKPFTPAAVPDDLQAKRDKLIARAEKKPAETDKPRKVNLTALAKKTQAQLDGIAVLERLTQDLVRLGIGNMNAKLAQEIEGQARQLGDAYLPGAQVALQAYTQLFAGDDGRYAEQTAAQREAVFSEALDQLGRLHAQARQGRAYLSRRLEDPDLKPETDSGIAAWLGHAWQLRELAEAGLGQSDVELVQLAFTTYDDQARKEHVETGTWMVLGTGRVCVTRNYRPFKAQRFIKSEDSFFEVAQVKEMLVYPGDLNPRVRWDGQASRPLTPADLAVIRGHAQADFPTAIKEVKNHLKGPLADKGPVVALAYHRLGRVEDTLAAEDANGQRLVLTDRGLAEEPPSCHLLGLLPGEWHRGQVMIARFRHDLDRRTLRIKPLSLVTPSGIIRLTF